MGTAAGLPVSAPAPIRMGVDLFSVRSQGWTAFEHLDYCARHGAKVVHFSEIRFMGGLEDEHLKRVRSHAEKLGVEIELGMRSICPSSKSFDATQGTAEEQLTRMIHSAKTVGSPIVRAFLGSMADRVGPIPLEQHIENTIKVLRSLRSRAMDAGIKIAIENHAGDMQARELRTLIEGAGKDFVGACVDSGNPLWTIEDPMLTLETLAPYALTSHVRDTALWKQDGAIMVQWVRLGHGNVGIREWTEKFQQLCPGRAFSMEVIVTQPRKLDYLDPKYWDAYRSTPAWEFARFLALAERGKPYQGLPAPSKEEARQREREDLEESIKYCRDVLKV